MPLIDATLTPGAYEGAARDELARLITEAAFDAESIPDVPSARARGIVLLRDLAPGGFYCAGRPTDDAVRGVFATLHVSAGVLDAARKARLAAGVQAAAEAAAPDRSRPVVTSLVIVEVPEGQWCRDGRIARLPDVAAVARFEHLAATFAPRSAQ